MYKVETFGPDSSLLSLRENINIFAFNKEIINVSISQNEYEYVALVLYKIDEGSN